MLSSWVVPPWFHRLGWKNFFAASAEQCTVSYWVHLASLGEHNQQIMEYISWCRLWLSEHDVNRYLRWLGTIKWSFLHSSYAAVIACCAALSSLAFVSSIVIPCTIPLWCSHSDWEYSLKSSIIFVSHPPEVSLDCFVEVVYTSKAFPRNKLSLPCNRLSQPISLVWSV